MFKIVQCNVQIYLTGYFPDMFQRAHFQNLFRASAFGCNCNNAGDSSFDRLEGVISKVVDCMQFA